MGEVWLIGILKKMEITIKEFKRLKELENEIRENRKDYEEAREEIKHLKMDRDDWRQISVKLSRNK